MSKIAYLADVHLGLHKVFGGAMNQGLNRRARETLEAFRRAVGRAMDLGCEEVRIMGDLFDVKRPVPALYTGAIRILRPCRNTILLGNHEHHSNAEGDHALGPLTPVSLIIDLPSAGPLWGRVSIPFRIEHNQTADVWIPAEVRNCAGALDDFQCSRVLELHAGIKDADTPAFMKNSPSAINADVLFDLMDELNFSFCFCGDWHDHKHLTRNSRDIVQIGALCPTGFANLGGDEFYGSLIVFDSVTNTIERHVIPGPRFYHLDSVADAPAKGENTVYAHVKTDLASQESEEQALAAALEAGTIDYGMVTVKHEDAANSVSVQMSSLEEATAAYFAQGSRPDGEAAKLVQQTLLYLVPEE